MRRGILFAVAALSSCHAAARPDPAYYEVTERLRHVDVTRACGRWERIAREADLAYELLSELLEVRPSRTHLAVVDGPLELDALAPTDARGSRGLYYADPEPLIVTYDQDDLRVIRHEMAHHFVAAVAGGLPRWAAEGLCEILGGIRRAGGRVVAPLLVPDRLEMVLRCPEAHASPVDGARIDYTAAWAAVAVRLHRLPGRWSDRLRALERELRGVEPVAPPTEDLLALAAVRQAELAEALDAVEPWDRAAAARTLGRLGAVEPLREAFRRPGERAWVRTVLAGALARAGDRSAVEELRPRLRGGRDVSQLADAAGLGFTSLRELDAWLAQGEK